jgi:hypothetical protein
MHTGRPKQVRPRNNHGPCSWPGEARSRTLSGRPDLRNHACLNSRPLPADRALLLLCAGCGCHAAFAKISLLGADRRPESGGRGPVADADRPAHAPAERTTPSVTSAIATAPVAHRVFVPDSHERALSEHVDDPEMSPTSRSPGGRAGHHLGVSPPRRATPSLCAVGSRGGLHVDVRRPLVIDRSARSIPRRSVRR